MWAAAVHTLLLVSGSACPAKPEMKCYPHPSHYKAINNTASPMACCNLCSADEAKCRSWSFYNKNGLCYLKPGPPTEKKPITKACNTTSGTMPSPQPPTPATPTPSPSPKPAPTGAMNVLFLMVDDLRPEFNKAYGQSKVVTPHLDKFMATSLTFDRAFAQFSHCSPSRNSFMTGRSPQTTGVYNFVDHFRQTVNPAIDSAGVAGPDWTSMPQHFRKNGYYVSGGGKLFHPKLPPADDYNQPTKGKGSWDNYFKTNGDDRGCRKNETIFDDVCPSAEPDEDFYDYDLAAKAVAEIRLAKAKAKLPFFIAAGFRRPHLKFHVPERFYDLYANNGTAPTNIPLAKHKTAPKGMPLVAYALPPWPLSVNATEDMPIPNSDAALGRWGYYSAVSFTDSNIGMCLDVLEELSLTDSTIAVVAGDHGWHLGEHGEWCKRTTFELGVRIPLMIRSPKHAATSFGRHTSAFAEALDFYRTLNALAMNAGSSATAGQVPVEVEAGVEGVDLSPLFVDPASSSSRQPLNASFSQMSRCPISGLADRAHGCAQVPRAQIEYMGYSIRVDEWRYTAWIAFNGTTNRGEWADTDLGVTGEELYSHVGDNNDDYDAFENENVVAVPEHKAKRDTLLGLLKAQFEPAA